MMYDTVLPGVGLPAYKCFECGALFDSPSGANPSGFETALRDRATLKNFIDRYYVKVQHTTERCTMSTFHPAVLVHAQSYDEAVRLQAVINALPGGS
ncbi:hypothetical protein [Streptomyces sp. RG80]|uniref:hypothetical protein n=1 Tax=Streptomyces sp. RG80 TaxID=3157340 RepID=UPI00338E97A9